MFDRFAGSIRRIGTHRAALDSYLASVQKTKCACGPKYDEAIKDFNGRIRGELRGYLG